MMDKGTEERNYIMRNDMFQATEIPYAYRRVFQQLSGLSIIRIENNIGHKPIFQNRFVTHQKISHNVNVIETTTSQKLAHEIMGRNFFGIKDGVKHFGIIPSEHQLDLVAEIKYSESRLERCQDTHYLVAVPLLSVLGIHNKVEHRLFFSSECSTFDNELFASNSGDIYSWQLLRKTEVAGSLEMIFTEQQKLLHEDEEIPSARVVVYSIISNFLKTGERLFEKIFVRTSDSCDLGCDNHVCVGLFDAGGLCIECIPDNDDKPDIGLASCIIS